jgi:hypothetical protein
MLTQFVKNVRRRWVEPPMPKRRKRISLPLLSDKSNPIGYVSIAAIFKDEAHYLREWIEFHNMLGVEHFFL